MGPIYFTVTKVFLQPFPLLLLLTGVGLASLWRGCRERRALWLLATLPFAALLTVSTPAVVYPLVGTLEWGYPPLASRPVDADAIVVLAGGVKEPDRTRARAEPDDDTLWRCLLAAELYHGGAPCPVVVTGGVLDPRAAIPPVAPVMSEVLVRLGVRNSDILVEASSRTTYENAVETRKVLAARGLVRPVVVTEGVHISRSMACFRKQGVNAVPAPCRLRATELKWRASSLVPSADALKDFTAVTHEWLGLALYRLTGKI